MVAAANAELLVADSFRARLDPFSGEVEVRGFGLHLDRFAASVAITVELLARGGAQLPDDWWELVFEPFMESIPERIAEGGDGFPRIELWYDGEAAFDMSSDTCLRLEVRLRPLPKLGGTLKLIPHPAPPREMPGIKGPNIPVYASLNREHDGETLLVGDDGNIIEGATTSIIWWDRTEDRGYIVARRGHDLSRVDSITEALIDALSPRRPGLRRSRADDADHLTPASITPDALAEHEVWAVNALHGIRAVSAIGDAPTAPRHARRIAWFRDALEDTWQSVTGEFDEFDDDPDTPDPLRTDENLPR